jgi:hypothetical protein
MPKDLRHQISSPVEFEQKVHVDKDFNWSGGNPNDVFDLTKKLGEG